MDKTMKELKAEVTDMGLDHSMNIYQRMLKAQSMVETVSKNLQVDAGKQRYKAVSERDILDAVKKVEDKCGIYSYPFERKVYESKATANKNGYETQWMRIQTVYRLSLIHISCCAVLLQQRQGAAVHLQTLWGSRYRL